MNNNLNTIRIVEVIRDQDDLNVEYDKDRRIIGLVSEEGNELYQISISWLLVERPNLVFVSHRPNYKDVEINIFPDAYGNWVFRTDPDDQTGNNLGALPYRLCPKTNL